MDLERLKDLLAEGGDHLVAADWLTQFAAWKTRLERELSAKAEALALAQAVLEEKERLLEVFHRVGRVTLSSLDLEEVLDNLTDQIVASGLFRSFMVALVDEASGETRVVRSFTRQGGSSRRQARRVGDEDVVALPSHLRSLQPGVRVLKHGGHGESQRFHGAIALTDPGSFRSTSRLRFRDQR